jgi:hypothetical protein
MAGMYCTFALMIAANHKLAQDPNLHAYKKLHDLMQGKDNMQLLIKPVSNTVGALRIGSLLSIIP